MNERYGAARPARQPGAAFARAVAAQPCLPATRSRCALPAVRDLATDGRRRDAAADAVARFVHHGAPQTGARREL